MKKAIDALIPKAYDVLDLVGIAVGGVIDSSWRGQVSAFGSAIRNGSLIAAVAFFSEDGSASVKRSLLIVAIERVLDLEDKVSLFEYIRKQTDIDAERKAKQMIINAAVALKLAMNLYEFKKKDAFQSTGGAQ